MTTAVALRQSLSLGLVFAGSILAACGTDPGGNGGPATSSGTGTTSTVQTGSTGPTSTTSGGGSNPASTGASSSVTTSTGNTSSGTGAGGTDPSGGSGGTSGGSGGAANGGSGGSAGSRGSGGSGGMTDGGIGGAKVDGGTGGPIPTGATEYSPYYEIGSTTGAFTNLVNLKTKAGVNDVTLAFVLSGGNCTTDRTISGDLTDIKAFVAAGGHVKASFGGASGTYVEAGCADATALSTAYNNFVDATGITDLDFDVEQGPVETAAVNTKRGQALKMTQDAKNIQVSFTLQTDLSGLDSGARAVVTGAANAGVKISHVNLMVMDYGNMAAGTPIAPIAIRSLNGANTQLKAIIPGLTTAQAWAMLGATPDIGNNDDNEIFTLKDAQDLTTFAKQNGLGLISFWNIQRDQVCGRGECSGHDVANFDYSNIFKTLAP